MRKKGRAHPDRLEATASHNTIKKTLASVDAAMNASDGPKARELLCSLTDHIAGILGLTPESFRKTVMASEEAMVSRDAWIAYRRSRGPAEAEFGVYDNPKMTWKALFGAKTEAIETYIDGLAREATGDALGAIGQRLVKGIEEGPDGLKVARLDLGALEDVAKSARSKYVALAMPRGFAPEHVVPQGNVDCQERGAACVPRALLKAALASLRNTANDSHAWVDVSVVWTQCGQAVAERPHSGAEPNDRMMSSRYPQRFPVNDDDDPPPQEVRFRTERVIEDTDDDGNVTQHTIYEESEWVPIYGPIRVISPPARADLMFKWAVMRVGGREGHIRLHGQQLSVHDTVDIVHTEPLIIRPRVEKAAA